MEALAHRIHVSLTAESAPQSYDDSRLMTDHPAVLGAFGIINDDGCRYDNHETDA